MDNLAQFHEILVHISQGYNPIAFNTTNGLNTTIGPSFGQQGIAWTTMSPTGFGQAHAGQPGTDQPDPTVTSGQATILLHAFTMLLRCDSTEDLYPVTAPSPIHHAFLDFLTRRMLLRCDSTGDLYPVTAPSPIHHAFLVSQHTWHQRLGHSGGEVLRRLVSSNFISYNKEKPPVLCHACQLGKHVRLSFVSSSTVISSCFDIVHSDVWTSFIPGLSSIKYYVLFLDHYSQFVWVYPLVNKSDVMSKFVLFRNHVRIQFKCEIKSFQCDHG
nr:ribonuclease H-like domain-containing protein [Tanacetum cinerariifolium]